jgi:hypothetical protein
MSNVIDRLNEALGAMTPPLDGACICGAVTYMASATPIWSGHCHCHECQKLSGAPFVSAFSVPADSFSIQGPTREIQRRGGSGARVSTYHCAACDARMFAQSARDTSIVSIFASTLRDPSVFRPVGNVYLSEAASWVAPPPALFNFPKMPPPGERKR